MNCRNASTRPTRRTPWWRRTTLFGVAVSIAGLLDAQVLFNETFTGGTSTTGFTTELTSGENTWSFANPGGRTITGGFSGGFAILDSDHWCEDVDAGGNLVSAPFDASVSGGYSLDFDHQWRYCCTNQPRVEVWDGATWNTVLTLPQSSQGYPNPSQHRTIDITAATGGYSAAQVRFVYSAECAWWWAVDNIVVTRILPCDGTPTAGTISGTSTPACGSGSNRTLTYTDANVGVAGITWQWQSSVAPFDTWADVGTATSATYGTGTITETTHYRVVVTCSATGLTATSAEFVYTINPSPTVTVDPASASMCPGGSQVLTASGATTYSWSPSTGLSATTGDVVTATPSASTTYTVTGTTDGCNGTATASIVVNSAPTIASVSADPATICSGNNSQLQATATVSGFTMGSDPVSFIDIGTTGVSIGEITDDNEFNVTIPSFTFNGVAYTSIRTGTNGAILFGTSSGDVAAANAALPSTSNGSNMFLAPWWDDLDIQGTTYIKTQQVGDVFILQYQLTHNDNTVGTVLFQVQLELSTGKIHFVYQDVVFDTTTTTQNAGATATVGIQWSSSGALQYSFNTASLSEGQVITFTPNMPAGYSWSPTTFLSDPNIANPVATSVTETTTYTVTVNSSNGCSSTGDVTVTIGTGAPPVVDIAAEGPTTFCSGGSVLLTSTVTEGCQPYTYAWSDGTNTVGTEATFTANASGSYTLTVTDNASQVTTSSPIEVTVNPTPTSVPTSNSPVCVGGTLDLMGGTDIGTAFTWSGPASFSSSDQDPSITNVTAANAGTYSLVVSDGTCTSAAATVTVVIGAPTGPVTITPPSASICPGSSVSLTASGGLAAGVVTSGAGASTTTASTTSSALGPNPLQTYYGNTKTQMMWTASELSALGLTAGSSITSIAINMATVDGRNYLNFRVKIQQTASVTSLSSIVSTGWSTVYGPQSYTAAVGYNTFTLTTPLVWDGTSNVLVEMNHRNNDSGGSAGASARYDGSLSYTACNFYRADGSTTDMDAYTGTPSFTYSARPQVRFGTLLGGGTFTWAPAETLNTSTGATVIASPTEETTYTATVTLNGCSSSNTVTVSIGTPTPPSVTVNAGGETTFCEGGSVLLSSTVDGGCAPFTYAWSDGVSTVSTDATYTATTGGTYTLTVTDFAEQQVTSDPVTVTVNPVPTASASSNGPICAGSDLLLTGTSDIGTSYSWTGPNGFSSTDQDPVISAATVDAAGTYSLVATADGCNSIPATVDAVVNPSPSAVAVTPASPTICLGDNVSLTASGGEVSTLSNAVVISGAGASTSVANSPSTIGPNPMQNYYGGVKTQTMFLASELTALGFAGGSQITAIGINLAAANGTPLQNFRVKAQLSSVTALSSSWISTGWTTVFPPASVTPVVGWNTLTLTTPITWDGTSSLVLEFNYTNSNSGSGSTNTAKYDAVSYVCTYYHAHDGTVSIDDYPPTGSGLSTSYTMSARCQMQLSGTVGSVEPGTFTWSPADGLSGTTGATVTAAPTTTTTYTVTSAGTNGCSTSGTVTVSVNEPVNAGTDGAITACSIDAPFDLFALLGGEPQEGGSWTFNGNPHSSTFDPAVDEGGTYTYTVDGVDPCPDASASVNVTRNVATTWYADVDGDGYGDPAVSQAACEQPDGFVADNSDLCVDDPNKRVPGQCGCGIPDTDSDGDGIADCVDSCPLVPGVVGSTCNDNDLSTINDVLDASCQCVGTPVSPCPGGSNVALVLSTDAHGEQTSWDIIPQAGGAALCSGSGYASSSTIVAPCCLPDGCYALRVFDSFGDGMTTGGYVLRDANNQRIIDNDGNGNGFTSLSQIANGNGFCLPLGPDHMAASSCDQMQLTNASVLHCEPNPAVSAQWLLGNQNDDGYEFHIFDPNGGYSRKIFVANSNPNVGGPYGNTRASYVRISAMVTNPVPQFRLLNVRVRSAVNGVYTNYGPVCTMKIDPSNACQTTQLTTVGTPAISCGATGLQFPGGRIYANEVAGATNYMFQFSAPGYTRNITSTTRTLTFTWVTLPLQCGTTYDVRVRVSLDNGLTYCPFGPICQISTAPCARPTRSLDAQASADLRLWPNPNRGDQLFLAVDAFQEPVQTVALEITDLFGKRVMTATLPVAGGSLNTLLQLHDQLASGVYLLHLTAEEQQFSQRLVIQR